MNPIGKVTVAPVLPARLERLNELARNLYWSWTPHAWGLYRSLNPEAWEKFEHNPVRTLLETSQIQLDALALDKDFLERFDAVMGDFDAYMNPKKTWFSSRNIEHQGKVAYFSAEFGFVESLPIYSGGLGVLAGDHCKSASDLGLPFVGVGLMYHQGYFRQSLNKEGWQEESYEDLDLRALPLTPLLNADGSEVRVKLTLPGREVQIRAWKIQVGRVPVYVLDTNVLENREDDRALTARLYGGGQEMRIAQEMVLGVGGVRLLRALKEEIGVYHMNEGHAAFLGLERVRELLEVSEGAKEGALDFWQALEVVRSNSVFTTHTPVPAGNDAFPQDIVDQYLGKWYARFAISRDEFMNLALHHQPWGPTFSMTVLALKSSSKANGVSELHGHVSRRMWNFLYPGANPEEVPIGHVTNGAHSLTFIAQELRDLYSSVLPKDWTERLEDKTMWKALEHIPDADLADAVHTLKVKMIDFVRERLKIQYTRNEASARQIQSAESVLDPHALTLGFARRFATYKRATLLFSDLERLKRIVNDPTQPVQFVFAGKAHPADNPGKQFIQAIYRFSQDPDLLGKIVILENYDMNVARHLVQGVDIWLNNPRRPLEASGTSGMKASFNGALNFSILDGWWRESFDGHNGYAIGDEREFSSLEAQDDFDAFSLYETLEKTIVPSYYQRDESGTRAKWMGGVRRAIESVAPQFSMQRQVIDYIEGYYAPLWIRGAKVAADHMALAKDLSAWKHEIVGKWNDVTLEAFAETPSSAKTGDTVSVQARVHTGGIDPKFLRVEAVLQREGSDAFSSTPLALQSAQDGWAEYSAQVPLSESGKLDIGARVLPYRPELGNLLEMALIKWG